MEHGPLTGQKLQSRTRRAATQARHYCFSSNIQVMVLGLQTLQLGLASLILSKRCRCFQCLKDHEDSLSRCFECSSFRDFLKLIPDADENKANEDSFHIFQMCLKEVLRAAGASESESMKNKLAWLKQEITSKRLVYESFMERTGAKQTLWILCRNNCFQSIVLYKSAVSTRRDASVSTSRDRKVTIA